MPDMPMPPMPTKWIGPIWFGSFMLSNPQRGRTRSIGQKNGRPHKMIPLIWETGRPLLHSQGRAVDGDFRFRDTLRPPDMHPEAIEANAIKPALRRGGVKERGEAEHLRRLACEQLRLDDPDAGVDGGGGRARVPREGHDLMSHGEVTGPVDPNRPGAGCDQQQDVH